VRRYAEFAVVALVLAALLTLLLMRLDTALDDMERTQVQNEVAGMRLDLLDVVAHREAFGGKLPGSDNPVEWIGHGPSAYIGAFPEAPRDRGIWYYDQGRRALIYRFKKGGEEAYHLSRAAGSGHGKSVLAGVGLLRVENSR